MLISPEKGGNIVSHVLGIDAKKMGYDGAIFPSVRALNFYGESFDPKGIRQLLHYILNYSSAQNTMDLAWQAVEQMKSEFNIVVFSGEEMTKSISSLEFIKANGERKFIKNPFYNLSSDKIELERLRERAYRGLTPS